MIPPGSKLQEPKKRLVVNLKKMISFLLRKIYNLNITNRLTLKEREKWLVKRKIIKQKLSQKKNDIHVEARP